jgi:hypothetical protein
LAQKPVCIEGIGGRRVLELEGDFSLADHSEITIFCVDKSDLPPGTQVLLGLSHVKSLAVSLDFALLHPYCELRAAREFARVSPLWDSLSSLPLYSPPQEMRLSTLFYLGVFGLCLFLIFPILAEDGRIVPRQWIAPLPEFRTLIATLGLAVSVWLSGLAGNLSESFRSSLFIPPPEGEERTLRVTPSSSSGPQLNPRLPPDVKRRMESYQGFYAGTFASPLPSQPPLCRPDWSQGHMAPRSRLEGFTRYECAHRMPPPARAGLASQEYRGPSPPEFANFRSHPMMNTSSEAFGAFLPPPRHRVPSWGEDRARKNISRLARKDCGLSSPF